MRWTRGILRGLWRGLREIGRGGFEGDKRQEVMCLRDGVLQCHRLITGPPSCPPSVPDCLERRSLAEVFLGNLAVVESIAFLPF